MQLHAYRKSSERDCGSIMISMSCIAKLQLSIDSQLQKQKAYVVFAFLFFIFLLALFLLSCVLLLTVLLWLLFSCGHRRAIPIGVRSCLLFKLRN